MIEKKNLIYKYLYNGNCLKECPSGTINNNYICKADSDKCILGKNDIYLAENDNLEIIETLVKTYISEFDYTIHYISLYENKSYSIMIYKDQNCIKEIKTGMPEVDFSSCYTKVKNEYGITEDLIIVIVVDKRELNNHKTYYSFYNPKSGFKLDAERICKDETIVVVESLNTLLDKNDTYYETQTSLTSQGINIFDINDPFYTDICYDFDNPLKKDIPLNDRIKDIYPDAKLCDEGCQYTGINLADMTATCDCKFNDITNNNLIKDNAFLDSAVGEIFDIINSSNILVFKCINNIFSHFSSSVGSWISLTLIGTHIGMTLTFVFVSIVKVNKYIYNLTYNYLSYITNFAKKKPKFPPKKNNIQNKRKQVQIAQTKSEIHFQDRKPKLKPLNLPKSTKKDLILPYNNDNTKLKFSDDLNIKTESKLQKKDIKNEINKKKLDSNFDQKFFKEYLSTSLDDLEFDDAVAKDKRKYCEHMKENLIEDQIIANTFIHEDPIKPRTIKIIVFILNVMLYFVVNGLFFSEEVISELYNINEEEENFFSFLPRSINRLIYTTLVSIVIGIITNFFFIDEKKIKGIFKREKDNISILKKNMNEIKKDLKKRYIAFIIIVTIILIISFLYLLCFNYVYPYSQTEWIKSSVAIMLIMQILSTLKCVLETSLRYLSYQFKNEKLYKISKFLD